MMVFGQRIDEETGKPADGYLTFSSGLKVILTVEECGEVISRLKMARVEGRLERQIAIDGLKFVCPKCGGTQLECCENGPYNSEVLNIDGEGDFDFGEINASGDVDRFQCLNCGYVLEGKSSYEGSPDYTITEHSEVVEWINENCEQGVKS